MSSIDPFVSDLGENDLARLGFGGSGWPQDVNQMPPVPETATQNGELWVLALAFENQVAATAPFENRLYFPVNPEEFSWAQARSVGTYDILNGPQATQLGSLQVRVFQLSGFFPSTYEADYCIPYPGPRLDRTPQKAQIWLTNAQRAGYPLMFSAQMLRTGDPAVFTTTKVVISNFSTSYRAGSPLDVFFDLELTEYNEPTIVRTATSGLAAPTWPATGKFKGHKYITTSGDTLMSIARAAYGKGYANLWVLIKNKNKTVVYGGKKHPLRNAKLKPVKHSNESLLKSQLIIIPKPPTSTR